MVSGSLSASIVSQLLCESTVLPIRKMVELTGVLGNYSIPCTRCVGCYLGLLSLAATFLPCPNFLNPLYDLLTMKPNTRGTASSSSDSNLEPVKCRITKAFHNPDPSTMHEIQGFQPLISVSITSLKLPRMIPESGTAGGPNGLIAGELSEYGLSA